MSTPNPPLPLSPLSYVRQCMHCKRDVTLTWNQRCGYYRGICTCGAYCTGAGRK